MNKQPFSWKKRIASIGYAWAGCRFFFRNEHNARLHLVAIVLVVLAGCFLQVSALQWSLLMLAIGLVLVAEALNTAIEKLVDLVSPEYDEQAKLIKDVAAGAVLLAAVTSLVIAILVLGTAWWELL